MNNEWIEWYGGKCPVSDETIEVRYRPSFEGEMCEHVSYSAIHLDWEHKFAINGDPSWGDIVAYRVAHD